jgi:4-phytase/acid phosphatase
MPGCNLPVESLPEGVNDPLFHPLGDAAVQTNPAIAKAAIAGRIGYDPDNLTQAYRQQIAALDQVLATCGAAPASNPSRVSLFDIPATLSEGKGDRGADLKGPLNTASTLSENLLLEYAEGMDSASVGWGCVHHSEIESMMALHEAATDFTQRTPEIARAQASNLLDHIRLSIQQAADQRPIHGALGNPLDRALFLIGHDTNQENIAGLLYLSWIIDGRRDDTPPGSALIFELWRNDVNGQYSVRAYFTGQTLEQMRMDTPLTLSNPAQRVPIFIPGCSEADMSCPLDNFLRLLDQSVDQHAFSQK